MNSIPVLKFCVRLDKTLNFLQASNQACAEMNAALAYFRVIAIFANF